MQEKIDARKLVNFLPPNIETLLFGFTYVIWFVDHLKMHSNHMLEVEFIICLWCFPFHLCHKQVSIFANDRSKCSVPFNTKHWLILMKCSAWWRRGGCWMGEGSSTFHSSEKSILFHLLFFAIFIYLWNKKVKFCSMEHEASVLEIAKYLANSIKPILEVNVYFVWNLMFVLFSPSLTFSTAT